MQPLPPRLESMLDTAPDVDFAARVREVSAAAAHTIEAMGELDLLGYEEPEVDGSADLAMWEQLAPLIGSTVAEVTALCGQLEASFPVGEQPAEPHRRDGLAAAHAALTELRAEVTIFGGRARDPAVVGDRWTLIAELQSFRFRARNRIGKLVVDLASTLGECRRREVEPGYEQALATTLVVRSLTADLRRLMRARILKVSEAPADQMLLQLQQMERELSAFGRTAAWRALRAQDKRGILEFRRRLEVLVGAGQPTKIMVLEALEPFVEFVEAFSGISQREFLLQHDQEVLASVGVALERATNTDRPEARLVAFQEALDAAQSLYGRSIAFDGFLRAQRKGAPTAEALGEQLEQFVLEVARLLQS